MSIISRPLYGRLSPQTGVDQLLVGDAEGAEAIIDLSDRIPEGFFDAAAIVYIPGRSGDAYLERLAALRPRSLREKPSIHAALPGLKQVFTTGHMGLRVYLAGTEGLIGQVMQAALEAGIDHTSIQAEQRGSLARRVQCVHCKGITENVTTQPATCSHCGLLLLVRDHYSRRLAAFQGVCINAEDPSDIPATEELFR
ncbi:dimethylamine monooxygenase subunit DmmA family protein [Mesorhizobium sp. SB112]|uniref:dimethylamine monooxygenase subunit DmmA family protein n=1 Tax=Mesorhizobium sp. SB112 TaxID=3151853 RepID=UPI0032664637